MEGITELTLITLLQLTVTWILTGMVWFTQLIHFPLYNKIKEGFVEYERGHIRRAALVFGPLMLIEMVSAIVLVRLAPEGILHALGEVQGFSAWMALLNTALTGLTIFVLLFLVSWGVSALTKVS